MARKGGRNGHRNKDAMAEDDLDVNELLNFRLPPRSSGSLPTMRRNRRGPYPVWNKEKFVNAQYRFAMHPTGDYVAHFADPDIYFQWKDIAQVIIPRQPPLDCHPYLDPAVTDDGAIWNCPICLSPPVAPRITKCGHIFCYPCFLHYLSTTAYKWAKCPICFDSITESQLKSVRWFEQSTDLPTSIPPGSSSALDFLLPMRLMFRPPFTTFALPVSSTWPSDVIPPLRAPFHFLPDVERFARFMLATPEYLQTHYSTDLQNLLQESKEREKFKDTLGLVFVEEAKKRVQHQFRDMEQMDIPQVKADIDHRVCLLSNLRVKSLLASSSDSSSLMTSESQLSSSSTPAPFVGNRHNFNLPSEPGSYFFYMAANGRHVFLHPLDIRILLSKYSRYSQFPPNIWLQVDAFVETSVDADLRKRYKYLAHLPEGSDVVFVEANLEAVIGREALRPFEVALRLRRNKRKEKERKEERARLRAEDSARQQEVEAGLCRDLDRMEFEDRLDASAETSEIQVSFPDPTSLAGESPWNGRSFAAAAQSNDDRRNQKRPNSDTEGDQSFQFEAAWQDLENRSKSTRKGRRQQLVILGGGRGGGRLR